VQDRQVNQTDPATFQGLLGRSLRSLHGSDQSLGLVIVNLEGYDRLLSAFGFRACSVLVAKFASALMASVRPGDRVVRISESRFAVLITPLRNHGILVLAANKISKICSRPITIDQNEITITTRIGIATGPDQGSDAEALLQNAETALLTAFSEDREFAIFSPEQLGRESDLLRLESELDAALKNKEFELYFQPKIATRDFTACGAEALMRWNNPERGFVSPEIFIPLTDRTGRMEPLTAFLLNSALAQASEWPRELSLSINLSPRMLQSSELVEMVAGALKLWDFRPESLIIEITEGAIVADPELGFAVLNQLRDLGPKISIDDFGTGYSSFAYFKSIPADELKIDKSFVQNMFDDEGDKKIVRAIVQLSKEFGFAVTAEGVEDERTARILAQYACDRLQGYHFSRPLPQAEFLSWLGQYRRQAVNSN
jgi:diguanylate cyclase (GGDEF)-like protein